MSRGLSPFAALAALLLTGCEVYAVPDPYPCPGVQQGVFDFSGVQILDPLPTCYFAQPGSAIYQVNNPMNGFQATISFDGDVDASLCVGNAHAAINSGTRIDVPGVGAIISVYYPPEPDPNPDIPWGVPVTVAGCTCPSAAAVTASGCICPSSSPTSNCSCRAWLLQNIVGTMAEKQGGGGFSSFTGTMENTVTFPPRLPSDLLCDCLKSSQTGQPAMSCDYSYALTAPAVNGR